MHVRHINVVVDDQTLNHPHHLPPRHGEDLIVTPFAQVESKCFFQPFDPVLQILASLRSVRNNYVTLTNVPPPHRWTRTDNLRICSYIYRRNSSSRLKQLYFEF